ncbi:hypothetical protein K8I61_05730, partial [bacterium]|nr:hypothetical protein [bacterium]
MTTYRPNRPQRSHRGIWLNILLNISLLGFLIFVARPFLSSLGPSSGAEGLVEIKGNTAIVPGTDIRVPVSKSDGVTRVIFVGAPPPGFASDDPFAHDMAGRAAMQAKGLTLEVFHLAAPDWTIGELARVAATAALLNPDLLVISPAAATPLVPAGTDEAALAASLADLLAPRTTPPPREESPTAMLERLSRPRRL